MRRVRIMVEGTKTEQRRFTEQLERGRLATIKGSTAEEQKACEERVWRFCKSSPLREHSYRAQSCKKLLDFTMYLKGRRYNVEVKCCNGVLVYHDSTYGVPGVGDTYTEDEVLSKIDLIIWTRTMEGLTEENFPSMFHVFTRAEFLQLLRDMKRVKKSGGEFFLPEGEYNDLGLKYTPSKQCWNIPTYKGSAGKEWVIDLWWSRTRSLEEFMEEEA